MPLFQIQDNDRPGFVLADSYGQAVEKWLGAVAAENDGEAGELPRGVNLIADDTEIIVKDDWLK